MDEERFYCPFPGCSRSFAELWRLKVHYRAAPDVRGSGKERGHGAELKACPKCGTELKPGRHHVGCVAGKKRARRKATGRASKVRIFARLGGFSTWVEGLTGCVPRVVEVLSDRSAGWKRPAPAKRSGI